MSKSRGSGLRIGTFGSYLNLSAAGRENGCGRRWVGNHRALDWADDPAYAEYIVVVIPTLNEEKAIGYVLDSVRESLKGFSSQILVVDGHSTDKPQRKRR